MKIHVSMTRKIRGSQLMPGMRVCASDIHDEGSTMLVVDGMILAEKSDSIGCAERHLVVRDGVGSQVMCFDRVAWVRVVND
jgi:hypothetical protein